MILGPFLAIGFGQIILIVVVVLLIFLVTRMFRNKN
jgi:hypothetical protein